MSNSTGVRLILDYDFKQRNYDRNIYRKRIKEGQCGGLFSYTNDLHDALLNKSGTEFWKSWRAKFGVSRTAHRVDWLTMIVI